jgi:hypothetical protein
MVRQPRQNSIGYMAQLLPGDQQPPAVGGFSVGFPQQASLCSNDPQLSAKQLVCPAAYQPRPAHPLLALLQHGHRAAFVPSHDSLAAAAAFLHTSSTPPSAQVCETAAGSLGCTALQ